MFLSSGQDDGKTLYYSQTQTIVNYIGIYLEYTLIYGPIITPTTSHHQFVVIRNVMSANPIKAVKRATVPVYKLIYVDSIQKRYSS